MFTTLLEGVLQSAQRMPNQIAIASPDGNITYASLINEATSWAQCLLKRAGASRLNRVVLLSKRTTCSYIAIISAMMTGAAFIPVNSQGAFLRNKHILKTAQADAFIIDHTAVPMLKSLKEHLELPDTILLVEHGQPPKLYNAEDETFTSAKIANVHLPNISENDLAYILFTSGSTGTPKGVPISHKNVCSFLKAAQTRYHINENDKLSQTFELTFDLACFDLFMAWCHGATVCAMRAIDLLAPNKYIKDNALTVWFSVPTVINLMQKQSFLERNAFPSLRLSLFCGEPILLTMLESWALAAPNAICENIYGPTELTIACAAYPFLRGEENLNHNQIVSIGKIFPQLDYCILNAANTAVKDDEIGELCVRGAQCFAGYLNDPQATAKAFVTYKNKVFYRTGDYVKQHCSGNLFYCGRADQQIKINGFRVELGEIEYVFNQVAGVERSVVLCVNREGSVELCAFVVGNVNLQKLQQEVKSYLPNYMMPKQIHIADTLPLNANGKIDRQKIIAKLQ